MRSGNASTRSSRRLAVGLVCALVVLPGCAGDLYDLTYRYSRQSREEAERLVKLAVASHARGDLAEAERLFGQALGIVERAAGPDHPDVGEIVSHLALLHRDRGRYPEAERFLGRALTIRDKTRWDRLPAVASLRDLAELYLALGKPGEAETMLRRALDGYERHHGPNHPALAPVIRSLADVQVRQGRTTEAEALYARALRMFERAVGREHPDVARTLAGLARLYHVRRQHAQAESFYRRALAVEERHLGPDDARTADTLAALADLHRDQGKYGDAEPLQRRAIAIRERAQGAEHPQLGDGLSRLADTLARTNRLEPARALYERARRIYLTSGRVNVDLDDDALRAVSSASGEALRRYAAVLAAIARDARLDTTPPSAAVDAFTVVDQIRSGAAHSALARAGARTAADDPDTAALARQAQDLRHRRQALAKALVAEYGSVAPDAKRVAALRTSVQRLDVELTAATDRLRRGFPRYAEVASPEPVDVTETARLLRPGEAMVSYFALADRVLAWVVRSGHPPKYREVGIAREELVRRVASVRASLDQSANPRLSAGRLAPFDVAGAHGLFTLLLAPFASELRDVTHLIVVPDETLITLPFASLVTRASGEPFRTLAALHAEQRSPSSDELVRYAQLGWLVNDHAITVLPSATSLRALRRGPRPRGRDVEPLIAFGDPLLLGGRGLRGGAMIASRGPSVSLDALRRLDRLPGTRDELLAVAAALGADPAHALYLDARATKPTVRQLNSSGRLGRARVVSFATHGLMAGDLTGLTQPALVLTPPAAPSEQDDGLLGLEDVMELRLTDTDWVVLSACNTAAGDGSGESLAGLARAFFFAGAPSLLVSYWSVEDRATQALMTEVFRRYARDPTLARAQALSRGMRAVMESGRGARAYFAHPFAWAAFLLLGEG